MYKPRLTLNWIRPFTRLGVTLSITLTGCPPVPPSGGEAPHDARARSRDDPRPAINSPDMESAGGRISVDAVIRSTTAFDLIVSADNAPAIGLEIAAEPLRGQRGVISAEHVRIYQRREILLDRFRNWYLRSRGTSEPRAFDDVLVPVQAPRQGQPYSIVLGGRMRLWVEIEVPHDAEAGNYTGAIVLRDSAGRSQRVPVALNVRPITLPESPLLAVPARVDLRPLLSVQLGSDASDLVATLRNPKAVEAVHAACKLLHAHGLSPYCDDLLPRLDRDAEGAVRVDWSQYDAVCTPLIDGSCYPDRRQAVFWPLPCDLRQPDAAQFDGLESTVFAGVLHQYLTECKVHAEEQGWLQRAFVRFELPIGPSPTAQEWSAIQRLAETVERVDPRIAFVSGLIPQYMGDFGWTDYPYHPEPPVGLDVWAPPGRFQHAPTLGQQQALGRGTWLVPDDPPFTSSLAVEAPEPHPLCLAWEAHLISHQAIHLLHVCDWPVGLLDQPIDARAYHTDRWMIYPGADYGLDEPVPSVRLKWLQQGLQDHHLLTLLAESGRQETARLLAATMVKGVGAQIYGDNYQDGLYDRRVDDPRLWRLARRILLDELTAAVQDKQSGAAGPEGASRGLWAGLLEATRRVRVQVESARVELEPIEDRIRHRITFEAAVRNDRRLDLEGKLTFGSLPDGTSNLSDEVRIGPLEDGRLGRYRIVAASNAAPVCDVTGHQSAGIVLACADGLRLEAPAVLSLVKAPMVSRPLIVDGDFSDWPPHTGNVAGNFFLTTWRSPEEPRDAPQSQTFVLFSRDESHLYVAVRAVSPPRIDSAGAPMPAFGNLVEYDDLMPVNEDLVEILLDPTNAATLTEDLFHIVLKSNGNCVFERGVSVSPPIGRVRPWPGPLPRYQVRSLEDGWSAEMALPLEAFQTEQAPVNPVWRINLARLEPIIGEYSNWSGASRHCYNPATLGNLLME